MLAFAGIVCFMTAACASRSTAVGTFPPAITPEGIPAWLHMANDSLPAELLSVQDDGLLVLVADSAAHRLAGRLVRVPFTALRRGDFAHAGEIEISSWRSLGAFLEGVLLPWSVFAAAASVISISGDPEPSMDLVEPSDAPLPEAYVAGGDSIAADSAALHRLRLLSRFPQGVDDQLLGRLEATYGEMVSLGPGGDP